MDYIEIVDVKEGSEELPLEHSDLLDKRLLTNKKRRNNFQKLGFD